MTTTALVLLLIVAGALGWKLTHRTGIPVDVNEDPPHDSYADVSRPKGPGLSRRFGTSDHAVVVRPGG